MNVVTQSATDGASSQQSVVIEWQNPSSLKPHSLNQHIYGEDSYHDLIDSIKELGVLQAIYCLKDNTIISGHRRWQAAIAAGVNNVPTIKVSFPSELATRRAIIEHNRYRIKNGLQLYNEGKEMEAIEAVRARQRQTTSTGGAIPQLVADLPQAGGKTRDIVAKTIGLGSGRQWDKLSFVGESKPELLTKIKPGGRSLNSAYNEVRRITKQYDINKKSVKELAGKYNVFYADPPWQYDNNSTSLRNVADNEYPTMNMNDLKALPIANHALDNSILFLWATSAMLSKAFELIAAWGFEFKTQMVWVKDRIGTGFFVRGKHENLLLATRGSFLPMTTELPDSVFFSDKGKPSQKPLCVFDFIERMYPNQKYCELFARNRHSAKWYVWGNEI